MGAIREKKVLKEALAVVAAIAARAKDALLAVPNLDKVLRMSTTVQ
jgi:hypothetical protein